MPRIQGQPTLQIGKSGITDTIIQQAKDMIKKHKKIKVKFLVCNSKDGKDKLVISDL